MRKACFLIFAALLLLALAQGSFAQWQETRITGDGAYPRTPRIWNNQLFWADARSYQSGYDEIRTWTSSAGESVLRQVPRLTTVESVYQNEMVLMKVVGSGNYDLYLWSVSTSNEVPISTAPGYQKNADIYGSTVVYEDHSGTYSQVMIWDAQNGSRPISPTNAPQYNPRISSGGVVWEDARDGEYLSVYRWTPGEGVTRLAGEMFSPAINGDRVMMWKYSIDQSTPSGLYEWTPEGGLTQMWATSVYSERAYYDFSGDIHVWSSYGPSGVVSWDPMNGYGRVNQTALGYAYAPSIYGNQVAWVGNNNIYLSTLIPEPGGLAVLGMALAGLMGIARRNKAKP
jgi:hypothetical protein